MKKEELDILLEKYYAGETIPEEEQRLRELFLSDNVPDGYEQDRDIFTFMAQESSMPPASAGINERIISALDDADARQIQISVRRRIYNLSGIAAAVLVILASWFFLTRSTEAADTFDDPELAYATAMKVLYDVSSKLNTGTESLQPVSRMNDASLRTIGTFDATSKSVGKKLKTLEQINETIEMTKVPDNINQPR